MQEIIGRDRWSNFVKEFNQRNGSRATRLEVLGQDIGVQEAEGKLPLTGLSVDFKGSDAPSVEITLGGETVKEERHLSHMIPHVKNIMRKIGDDLREEALLIEDEEGKQTILTFESLQGLPAGH